MTDSAADDKRVLTLMLTLMLTLAVALCAQAPAGDGAELSREVFRSGEYQTELPEARGEAGAERRSRTTRQGRKKGRADGPPRRRRRRVERRTRSSSDAGIILWLALAIGLVFVVVRIFVRAPRSANTIERSTPKPASAAQPAFALTDAPLQHARALAADGRFAEAIQSLLHHTFDALRAQRVVRILPSMTGRGIARSAKLAPGPKAALGSLVDAVERGIFARRELVQDDFTRCADAFERLAKAAASRKQKQREKGERA